MTEKEKFEVISKVVKNHRNKNFDIYSPEDIEQESWIIILKRIKEFDFSKSTQKDEKKALEHWLNRVLSTRLTNLYRDEYLVKQRLTFSKKGVKSHNLLSPLDINNSPHDKNLNFTDQHIDSDILSLIINHLDSDNLEILERLLSGEDVGNYYRHKINISVKNILEKECQAED